MFADWTVTEILVWFAVSVGFVLWGYRSLFRTDSMWRAHYEVGMTRLQGRVWGVFAMIVGILLLLSPLLLLFGVARPA
jgi:hypothetical protein